MSLISSIRSGAEDQKTSPVWKDSLFHWNLEKIPSAVRLTRAWHFRKLDPEWTTWEEIRLPHNPFVASLHGPGNWEGICQYRRTLQIDLSTITGETTHFLEFGAAMSKAKVFLDGVFQTEHQGGYLPFIVDLGASLLDGGAHELTVELDNRWDPSVPPGKPHDELDFCCYGGLYREVRLITRRKVYIVHENETTAPGCGGVFLQTTSFCNESENASLRTQVHLRNQSDDNQKIVLRLRIFTDSGETMLTSERELRLGAGVGVVEVLDDEVTGVRGWTPVNPQLYSVVVEVEDSDGDVMDCRCYRYGFRTLEISGSKGLVINGRHFRPRGCNRHQDHPFVGYALPGNAQFRDALRIKEAGFDFVRLSHYPQSSAFLKACDALGILVMNCIPGWQQITDTHFRKACEQNARELIRRDRNHPSVILWELSLNETEMDASFIRALHEIGKEESPDNPIYTCGWMQGYDVYLRARQHGHLYDSLPHDQALVVSEYGDWEYYANNMGFDQTTGDGLLDLRKNSRAFRGDGEVRLLQQCLNHISALEDTLNCPAVTDGLWCIFDYPRGYHELRAACGIMDFFRIPKWSYYFYRSQRDPAESYHGVDCGPMVFIANYWTEHSPREVWVFSNLDRVELYLNGTRVGLSERAPEQSVFPHPPRRFSLESYVPGVLEARAFGSHGREATHQVRTPGVPDHLEVVADLRSEALQLEQIEDDLVFVHAGVVDKSGNLCVESVDVVTFSVEGQAVWMGPDSVETEAGIASGMLRLVPQTDAIVVTCKSLSGLEGRLELPCRNRS